MALGCGRTCGVDYDEVAAMYRDEDRLDRHPREFWEWAIGQYVFDEVARYSITRNFLDGVPYEKIAEELNVSRATVYLKVRKYTPKLFKKVD